MIVNNCGNCPFMVVDVDYDCVGHDTLCFCNFKRHESKHNNIIVSYDGYKFEDKEVPELQTVLSNCPLLKEEINIKYEKI